MARTTAEKVRDIAETEPRLSLKSFISTAHSLTNKVAAADAALNNELSEDDLTEIETYLAAHFYGHRDQYLTSKSTGGASGSFQGQTAMLLQATLYGQTAMLLDVTGFLAKLNADTLSGQKRVASATWLGSPRSGS